MNALFVAIKFPNQVNKELLGIQPIADQLVRTAPKDRLHLTLRYIGKCLPDEVRDALKNIRCAPFEVCISGTGHFGSSRRGTILWAGIEKNKKLHKLQSKIETELVAAGCKPDDRLYKPHVTLARCKPKTPRSIIEEHHNKQIVSCFTVSEFGLYTSVPVPNGPPVYRLEHSYPLEQTQ